jgi:hypothetical protein
VSQSRAPGTDGAIAAKASSRMSNPMPGLQASEGDEE